MSLLNIYINISILIGKISSCLSVSWYSYSLWPHYVSITLWTVSGVLKVLSSVHWSSALHSVQPFTLPPRDERVWWRSASWLNRSTSIYFYLSVVWLLLRLTHSLSNLVMSCKVTCLPPRPGGWNESGIPGISLPGSLMGWMDDTVYTPQPQHTSPSIFHLLGPTGRPRHYGSQVHPGIVPYTLPTPG